MLDHIQLFGSLVKPTSLKNPRTVQVFPHTGVNLPHLSSEAHSAIPSLRQDEVSFQLTRVEFLRSSI